MTLSPGVETGRQDCVSGGAETVGIAWPAPAGAPPIIFSLPDCRQGFWLVLQTLLSALLPTDQDRHTSLPSSP